MSCARISREVIEFFRFGDLDAPSVPHLEHLAVCAACREEVGLDRGLVIQLQRALAARIDGHAPSPGAWLEIRRRALEPERARLGRLLPVLRLAPLGAAVILVLAILATPSLSPFRIERDLVSAAAEPTWRILAEVEALDEADGQEERWWLRYVTVRAPETGAVATLDRWERMTAAGPLGGYAR